MANYQPKRVTLFAGHYGSGKTNIAVNFAIKLKKEGYSVKIADLDIVNPYFRTKDSADDLAVNNIPLISPSFANSNVDLPALPAETYGLVTRNDSYAVLDIGGDDRGAYALGRYAPYIKEENNWLPDLDELRKMVRPNTKMICINNAHNPTGAVMDEAYLNELVEIARSCGAYILSDEVYKPMEDIYVPAIADIYEKGISTNSVSKTYSVPGVRVGWVASNLEVIDILRSYRDYTMICCGVFDDYVATYALKNKDKILKRNKAIIDNNLAILKEWVENEPRVSLIYPKHVSVCFIKLDIPMEIEEFCVRLLKDKGVLLIPGNRFEVDKHARLGYCAKTETLINGLKALSEYLRQFD